MNMPKRASRHQVMRWGGSASGGGGGRGQPTKTAPKRSEKASFIADDHSSRARHVAPLPGDVDRVRLDALVPFVVEGGDGVADGIAFRGVAEASGAEDSFL